MHGFPETFPVYIIILQDRNKRASGALCLPAFCHLGLKSDVSYWACSQAHLASRAMCMIPHWAYVMHHFLPQSVSRCYRLYKVGTSMKPHSPMGAAIAFRIVGTEFVSSCHAGLFRG